MNDFITLLQRRNLIWHGSEQRSFASGQASEYPELDKELEGGFPEHGVIDISSPQGIGELRLLLPYLKRQQRLLVFINPPGYVCAEQMYHYEVALSQVLIIFPGSSQNALWAAENCLKSGACGAVLIWQNALEVHHVKRLQVASETGGCPLFLHRNSHEQDISLPVSLGLSLTASMHGVEIEIRKRKGGWPQPPFTVNMQHHWPALVVARPANLIHFPAARAM